MVISLDAHKKQVNCVDVASGRIVTGGQDKQVILWRARDGYILKMLNGHTDAVTGVVFKDDSIRCGVGWVGGREAEGGQERARIRSSSSRACRPRS